MSLSKIDVYLRIKQYFERIIKQGGYLPGESLPSVRQVALDMGVNPNTVQKAYQMLAEENLVTILPKKGVFVCDHENSLTTPLKEQLVLLIHALQNDYTKEDIIQMVDDILKGETNHD